MKQVKIIGIALSLMCSVVFAEELTVLVLSPGGSTFASAQTLIPTLAKHGHTLNTIAMKSCAERIQYLVSHPKNTIGNFDSGDLMFSAPTVGSLCPPLAAIPVPVEIATSWMDSVLYLMNAPGFEGTTYKKMMEIGKSGKKIRIGQSIATASHRQIEMFVARNPEVKFAVLEYTGSGDLRAAIMAGDVDLYFGAALHNEMIEKGAVELAASRKGTSAQFLGELTSIPNAPELPELVAETAMLTVKGGVSPSVMSALADAFKSDEYQASLKKYNARHTGIGAGISGADTMKKFIKIEQDFGLAKK